MSLGFFKKISKISADKQFHSYENVQATNVSSHENKGKQKQHKSWSKLYQHVIYGSRHLAVLGETRRQPKQSGIIKSAGAVASNTNSTDGTVPQHEIDWSNRQELTKSTQSKSWRVHTRTDSDSSSSDGRESPDAKKRELEHYNKLKLNLNSPPRNKEVLKGIKILQPLLNNNHPFK